MSRGTRDRLLAAGERLFSADGFERTTVGRIEAEAGLTPRAGGFYRHFESKESLLVELAAQRFETPEDLGLRDVFPLGDTRAELIYIARAYERFNAGRDRLTYIIRTEAPRIPQLAALLRKASNRLVGSLTDWLAEKPAALGMDRGRATELVLLILGGWLFFNSRREEFDPPAGFDADRLLRTWAGHWAEFLDRESGAG